MASDFATVFAAVKPILGAHSNRLTVKADSPTNYTLDTKKPSPFPQHKGQPLFFGAVRIGKAYVSLHLMALYMCPKLLESMSPELKKRMQGKACFNFKAIPDEPVLSELKQLASRCLDEWSSKGWA